MESIQPEELYSSRIIDEVVHHLGFLIREDYREKDLVIIGILKGAFVFMSDLVRYLHTLNPVMGFIEVKSYRGTQSVGPARITINLSTDIPAKGKDILIIEDIIETGKTLRDVHRCVWRQEPASVEVCSLLLKDVKRKKECPEVKYFGFHVPADTFVIGYGLDLDGSYRALPYIGKLPGSKDASKEVNK